MNTIVDVTRHNTCIHEFSPEKSFHYSLHPTETVRLPNMENLYNTTQVAVHNVIARKGRVQGNIIKTRVTMHQTDSYSKHRLTSKPRYYVAEDKWTE